jgi:hypothetical protein
VRTNALIIEDIMIDGLIVLALGEDNVGQFYEMLKNLQNGNVIIGNPCSGFLKMGALYVMVFGILTE